MKYFIEELLAVKLIAPDQLVEAILLQSSKIPTAAEIVFQRKLLSPEIILQVLIRQGSTAEDFKTACQALNVWTDEIAAMVEAQIVRATPSLMSLLLQNRQTNLSSLSTVLEGYLANVKLESTAEMSVTSVKPANNKLFILALADLMPENWLVDFSNSTEDLAGASDIPNCLTILTKDIHQLLGISRYLNAHVFESILIAIENALSIYQVSEDNISSLVVSLKKLSHLLSEQNQPQELDAHVAELYAFLSAQFSQQPEGHRVA